MIKIRFICLLLLLNSISDAGTITTSFPAVAGSLPPKSKNDSGGFTSSSVPGGSFSPSTTTGNLVVVNLFLQSTSITINSITDGAGGNTWHVIGPVIGSNNETFLAWTVVTNSFASWQFNLSSAGTGDASGAEYTNMAGAGTVADCNSAGSSGNSTALTSGACTPTAANDLIVAAGGVMQNSSTMSAGAGFTVEQSNAHSSQGNSSGWEDGNGTSCNATTATATESVSGQWSFIMAAFKTNSPTACGGSGGGGSVTFN